MAAKCGLDSMSTTEIENAIQVDSFTIGVNDEEMVKTIWEKKLNFSKLDKVVKDLQEVRQILQQNQKIMVKQQPKGRKKEKGPEKKPKKKIGIRCGDNYSPEHLENYLEKSTKCNYCKKRDTLEKFAEATERCRRERKKVFEKRS